MTREEPKKGRTTKQKQNFGRPDPTALKIFTGPHLPTASGVFQQSHMFQERVAPDRQPRFQSDTQAVRPDIVELIEDRGH